MKTSLLWVCFLLNYFLEKGYPRMIEIKTDKGQSSYSYIKFVSFFLF